MNVPKIRFKEFKENWDNPIIDSIFELRNGYTPSKSIKEYWENGTIPWYRMEDIRAKGNILSEAFQYITPLAIKGSGLFKPYSIILATTATIGVHAMVIADSLANQQFTNFSIRKSLLNKYMPEFVNYAFYKIDRWSEKNTNSGGLLSVDVKSLLKEPFYTPYYNEQQKIASYFQSLDSLIQTTSKELTSLKQIKAASLQSMFPQKGETVPKVRFKGFEGKWKNLTLGEIGKWSKGRLLSKSDLTADGKNPCIHYGELFVNYSEVINEVESYTNVDNGCYSEIGDILFPDSDVTATGLARCSAIMQNGVILGGGINILKVDKKFYSPYISYSINQEKGQIISRVIGTTVRHINSTALSEVQIAVPSDIKEQQQIANYFTCLDKQITLQAQRLEKLKQIKAACLDKMFV